MATSGGGAAASSEHCSTTASIKSALPDRAGSERKAGRRDGTGAGALNDRRKVLLIGSCAYPGLRPRQYGLYFALVQFTGRLLSWLACMSCAEVVKLYAMNAPGVRPGDRLHRLWTSGHAPSSTRPRATPTAEPSTADHAATLSQAPRTRRRTGTAVGHGRVGADSAPHPLAGASPPPADLRGCSGLTRSLRVHSLLSYSY